MALDKKLISTLFKSIKKTNIDNLASNINHLLDHIKREVVKNHAYNKYEKNLKKWETLRKDNHFIFPKEIEDAKSYVYYMYVSISQCESFFGVDALLKSYLKGTFAKQQLKTFNDLYLNYFEIVINEIVNANIKQKKYLPVD
ncbi:MAG TPA: hypothetical protein DEA97_14265 [Bacteroidales bacterium]|nr:MAG: hypothetical protein UR43_C0011G0020 [candidate division TM6 bacterium GW2011_GWF2_33_332]HBS87723.1 hypothetical protein [Bacteroidales bacterium]